MAKHHTNLLGLAITETSVHLSASRGSGRTAKASKQSSFETDAAALFDDPTRFGEALLSHMQHEGYHAKHVAVGLCARWVLAHPMALPRAEGDALAGMTRLRIEREFAGGQADLCFDYQPAPTPAAAESDPTADQQGLLLVGMPKRRLEKLQAAMQVAGLELVRVGATVLDVCETTNRDGLGVVLDRSGLTLTSREAGKCCGFATTRLDAPPISADAASLQSTAAAAARLAAIGTPYEQEGASRLLLTDIGDTEVDVLDALSTLLAERFGSCDVVAADAALAAAQRAADPGAINLLDSKLAIVPTRGLPVYAKWLLRAAVLLLLIAGATGYFWYDASRELTELRSEYDAISDQAAKLQAVRDDTRAAAGWFDERPPVLDCLLELTHTFPRRGRIWVTSLSIAPDAAGTVSCRADDEDTMWLYVNAMNASPRLSDIVLRRQNDVGRQADEIVFDVSFRYDATAQPEEEAL